MAEELDKNGNVIPTMGRMVHYVLSEADAEQINRRRADWTAHRSSRGYQDTGYVAHMGDAVAQGDTFPAVVLNVPKGHETVDLKVFLAGSDDFYAVTRVEDQSGDYGTWHWPKRV